MSQFTFHFVFTDFFLQDFETWFNSTRQLKTIFPLSTSRRQMKFWSDTFDPQVTYCVNFIQYAILVLHFAKNRKLFVRRATFFRYNNIHHKNLCFFWSSLKVRLSRNEYMKSLIFQLVFWKIYDFIYSFRLNLTFRSI